MKDGLEIISKDIPSEPQGLIIRTLRPSQLGISADPMEHLPQHLCGTTASTMPWRPMRRDRSEVSEMPLTLLLHALAGLVEDDVAPQHLLTFQLGE